jgi:YbbR domain-containing protein
MIRELGSRQVLLLTSFVISIFLWFYVLNSEPLEVEKKIKLVLIPPTGKAVSNEVPRHIVVRMLGSRAFIEKINFSEQKIIVDLKEYRSEEKAFPVTFDASMMTLPFGVDIVDIDPKQVILSLDREIKKYVPVRLKTIGEVGRDLKLVEKTHSPKQFFISGPHEIIRNIGQVTTTPIDLSTLEGDGMIKVAIEPIDRRIFIKNKSPISFSYKIKPSKANLTLKKIKIRFLTTRGRFKSSHSLVALDVLVSGDKMDSLKKSQVKVIADIPDVGRGTVKVKLRAEVPDGVHLLKIHPEVINVRLR